MTTAPNRIEKQSAFWLGLLLVAVTWLVYWQTHGHQFVNLDDPDYVTENSQVQKGLTLAGIQWAFTHSHASNWQPLTFLSHMLDCQLFGLRPAGHHLVSVMFHSVNALLLFLLLARLTRALGASATVAALFALHPLHVESVAWISERKDVLSTFFGLLVLWCYVNHARKADPPGKKHWLWYLAALLCFALGLMSKPMLVTWPFVLLLLDFWPLGRIARLAPNASSAPAIKPVSLSRLIAEKIPFFGLTLISCIITFLMQRAEGAVVETLSLSVRLAHIPVAYVIYLAKTFWPTKLCAFYPYVLRDWTSLETLGAAALFAGITLGIARKFRQHPYLALGWFWFIGTMIPVIGLVQVGQQDVADRYTYIPHIGLFIALVWWLQARFAEWRMPRSAQLGLGIVMIAACGWLTHRQIPHWKNDRAMAEQSIRATPRNFLGHAQLATVLMMDRSYEAALDHCRVALRYQPRYAEAYDLMGAIFARQRKLSEAEANYRQAILLRPTLVPPHEGLAEIFLLQGRFEEAEQSSRTVLRFMPSRLEATFLLARALQSQKRFDEALALYQTLNQLKPDTYTVLNGLGSIHALKNQVDDALKAFQAASRLQPTNAEIQNSLGMLKLQRGDILEASNHFSLVATFQATNALANFQLGNLLVAAQQPATAATHYRRSLAADPNQSELLNNFAWLLATTWDENVRSGIEAVQLAERACEMTGSNTPLFLGTLAAAYAEAGRFQEAGATATKAIALARAQGLSDLAARNEELFARYQKRLPFHEERRSAP